MNDRNWFFVSREDHGWKVHAEGRETEDKEFEEKREAVNYGRQIARQFSPSLLVIQ